MAKRDNHYTYIDHHVFREIYLNYFSRLLRFVHEYVGIKEDAENIVQDVFLILWEHRDDPAILVNLSAYLFTLARNRCIDYLRHKVRVEKGKKKLQDDYRQEMQMRLNSLEALDQSFLYQNDREQIINRAIESLPRQCREIFIRHKIEGKKYKEIAEEMNISVNTVENQMGIALRKLREQLKGLL